MEWWGERRLTGHYLFKDITVQCHTFQRNLTKKKYYKKITFRFFFYISFGESLKFKSW